MPVLVVLIVFSLSFYVYYRVKAYRSNKPVEKTMDFSKKQA